ncbi:MULTISPECIES: LytR/AlgR family response regulator transcription factor [Leeuwenhoekiella]|jgi:DNA-binding LytR/AlgR family response regulator|uniref:LytR/AlgR family response regulator transcription factor n=1 Tax=Leeuwenhoekiella TaxID=283735 RepID=UPI000C4479D3|nr:MULTISPECIES: LytTR family DNA-binding domain-containing protein [Leeuwenhoekiella]MAO45472.1 DNA-binding response regulator [Leeuwenhoekiella sp.]MBQ50850.1 DNA-binding response regulator [Leeuwenhoekiella sp.]HBT08444.1 DNA-binding response regulator [Leeuwenhoekiella sp.]HCW65342.1 DNA-binding response regulator [Leeuwenhoekiella sp.]|tara:strand:+ start:1292 stop:2011 length:720 start_codon:yes stop_codon:yes gene_type:complete
MNCIIIDDEALARSIIRNHCEKSTDVEVVAQFENAISAIKYLNQNEVDLIFLDIHMPDFTGFDFIQTLKSPPKIILTTSDRNFAIEAFEYDCIVDYLVKPVGFPRFLKAIQKAQQFSLTSKEPAVPAAATEAKQEEGKDLYINIDRRLIKIDFDSILIIEAKGDYILIKTEGKNYTVHSTLKKIEEKLPESKFLKIHRSYVINFHKIIDIEDNSVLIAKDVIPISRSNRPILMKRLNLL